MAQGSAVADIFVSYASEDRTRVRPLVEALRARGWEVWWDRQIEPGTSYDRTIESEVSAASCVLVIWTNASVRSEWVQTEAMEGLNRRVLVPILMDDVEPPLAFRRTQTADLREWPASKDAADELDRLIASITRLTQTNTTDAGSADPPLPDQDRLPTAGASDSQKARQSPVAIVWTLLIGAAMLAVYFLDPWTPAVTVTNGVLGQSSTVDVSRPVEGFGGRGAVAVLPFINMSEDAGQEYFADGITEDIITSLQAWGVFPVISRNSTFAFKGEVVDVPSMAGKLGVRYVLAGSVRTVGNRVRITAQLIDAESNASIWAKSFNRDMTHIFALQDEITEQIVTAIAPEITRGEMRRVSALRTADLEAYDLVLKALSQIQSVGDTGSARELIALLDRAIEIDPNYALAWARRAEAEHNLITGAWRELGVDRGSLVKSALEYARRAVQLDPNLVEARIWYGHLFLHAGRLEDGVNQLKAAVALNPSHAQAHAELGHGLALSLRLDEAIAELDIAARLSPNDPRNERILGFRANAYYWAEQYEEAALVARRAIEASQGQQAAAIYGYRTEVASFVRLGRMEDARAASEEYINRFGATDVSAIQYGTWGPGQAEQMIADLAAANFGAGHSGSRRENE
jgi:TolB-like protein/Tfp pilus assembly protein PilF